MTAAEFIRNSRMSARRVALHLSFFPADAMDVLRRELPSTTFVEAFPILEELRAVKTKQELAHLKAGAAAVVDSVLATFQTARPGVTEAELADRLRLEQSQRGLVFDYALITSGSKFGRAPSDRSSKPGEVLSLDTAGYWRGYVAARRPSGAFTPKEKRLRDDEKG